MNPTPRLEATDLLEHRRWMLGLARALVGDHAEDLVQETFLTALQTPPRSESAWRAWLGRVLRNKASLHRRSGRRRRRREERAARPEAIPEETLTDRVELQARMAHALLELPEPDRRLILRRFYAEESPKEIARELSIPASTVRTRLDRALQKLRKQMDERKGSPRDWRAICVLWLRTGSSAVGGSLLLKKVAAAILLVVLAGFGGYWWTSGSEPSKARLPIAHHPGETVSRDGAPDSRELLDPFVKSLPPATPSEEKEPPAPVGIVRGHIFLASGASLEGARVGLWGAGAPFAPVDAAGFFEIRSPVEADTAVLLEWQGCRVQVDKVEVRFDPPQELTVEVDDGDTAELTVVSDVDGSPVEGVSVWVHKTTHDGQAAFGLGKTDAGGHLTVPFLPPTTYEVMFRHPSYAQLERVGSPSALSTTVRLTPARPLRVTLVNWVPTGRVQFHFSTAGIADRGAGTRNVTEVGTPDAAGVLTIRSPGDGEWNLHLSGEGRFRSIERRVTVDTSAGSGELEVVLPARGGIQILGRLTNAWGDAIPAARVLVGEDEAITDALGEFVVESTSLERRSRRILVRLGDGNDRTDYPRPGRSLTNDPQQRFDIRLEGALTLEIDWRDLPPSVIGEFLTANLLPLDGGEPLFAVRSSVRPLRLSHLRPGRYRLDVEIGSAPLISRIVELTRPDAILVIPYTEPARISIELGGAGPHPSHLSLNDLPPVKDLDLRGMREMTRFRDHVPVHAGMAVLRVPPELERLRIQAPGRDPVTVELDLRPGEERLLRVTLPRTTDS